MSETIDRRAIEAMVREALKRQMAPGSERPASSGGAEAGARELGPERGAPLIAPQDPAAMQGYLASTLARIGVGRTGTRYRTATMLRFRADHAAAKDAVWGEVDSALVSRLGFLELRTQADDKKIFLIRPDRGRALSEESKAQLAAQGSKSPQVQLIYGDGLSAAAINAHLEPFHGALTRACQARGLKVGIPIFVRYSRVKVMDEIARIVNAEAAVFACGERPGLGYADSLSAYYMYKPPAGASDADREVVSNINPRGVVPEQAATQVADSLVRVLKNKKSGVVL